MKNRSIRKAVLGCILAGVYSVEPVYAADLEDGPVRNLDGIYDKVHITGTWDGGLSLVQNYSSFDLTVNNKMILESDYVVDVALKLGAAGNASVKEDIDIMLRGSANSGENSGVVLQTWTAGNSINLDMGENSSISIETYGDDSASYASGICIEGDYNISGKNLTIGIDTKGKFEDTGSKQILTQTYGIDMRGFQKAEIDFGKIEMDLKGKVQAIGIYADGKNWQYKDFKDLQFKAEDLEITAEANAEWRQTTPSWPKSVAAGVYFDKVENLSFDTKGLTLNIIRSGDYTTEAKGLYVNDSAEAALNLGNATINVNDTGMSQKVTDIAGVEINDKGNSTITAASMNVNVNSKQGTAYALKFQGLKEANLGNATIKANISEDGRGKIYGLYDKGSDKITFDELTIINEHKGTASYTNSEDMKLEGTKDFNANKLNIMVESNGRSTETYGITASNSNMNIEGTTDVILSNNKLGNAAGINTDYWRIKNEENSIMRFKGNAVVSLDGDLNPNNKNIKNVQYGLKEIQMPA